MASRSHVELDFFRMEEKHTSSIPVSNPHFDRRRSFKEIQNAISKMNPEVVKSVIASVTQDTKLHDNHFSDLPVYNGPVLRNGTLENSAEKMTIFYNGKVSVFDVPKDKAEYMIKYAMEEGSSSKVNTTSSAASFDAQGDHILEALNGDLPMAPKKSLKRFFEKRKGRLISVAPYPVDHVDRLHKTPV